MDGRGGQAETRGRRAGLGYGSGGGAAIQANGPSVVWSYCRCVIVFVGRSYKG
jgi:hypothetical protein